MSWSEEAELSVLGSILIDDMAYEMVTDTGLKSSDFMLSSNRIIFTAIEDLAAKGVDIDLVTVSNRLASEGTLDKVSGCGLEGREYISHLTTVVPSIDNAKSYASIVYEHSRKRKLKGLAEKVRSMADEGEGSNSIQDYIGSELLRISEGADNNTAYTANELLKKCVDELKERNAGGGTQYKTGLTDLDDVLRIEAGRCTMIAGRPGMGKSAMANQIIIESCKNDIPVICFTMEMSGTEVMNRLLCSVGNINNGFIQDPKDYIDQKESWSKLIAAAAQVKNWPLLVDEKTAASADHIRTKVRSFFRKQKAYTEEGKGIVIIDYLGLMKMSESNRVHAIGEISKALKSLAGELKIPVIVLHQLNRGVEARPDKRPHASDLRDSGELEEDMDHIVMVYRDEVYDENTNDKGVAELIIRKNRTGQNNVTVRVATQLQFYKFTNLAAKYYDYNLDN